MEIVLPVGSRPVAIRFESNYVPVPFSVSCWFSINPSKKASTCSMATYRIDFLSFA